VPFEVTADATTDDGRERNVSLAYKDGDTQLPIGVVISIVGDPDLIAAYGAGLIHSLTGKRRRRRGR
jgi:hypothetical protein